MSIVPIDSGGTIGADINHTSATIPTIHQGNSSEISNGQTTSSNRLTSTLDDSTWINTFHRFDRLLSGSLLHLFYRFIDIIILLIGLTSNKQKCPTSNRLSITSICLLIFYFIDLTIILLFLLRNFLSRNSQLTDEQKLQRLRHASIIRGFFMFFKFIPICVGTAYSFSSTFDQTNDCELMRFCLGTVCLSTWFVILIPPRKPELPARRSLTVEGFVLLFILIINLTYIGTVATAIKNVNNSSCIFNKAEDFYLSSPLKSFGYVGIILFACTTIIHVINLITSQLTYRFNRGRQFYIYYYALQYTLTYFEAIVVIYYFSVGGLFLFSPRSGQPCRDSAPDLYKTLLIWEWIRILSPLIAIPLLIILCCLGVVFGIILTFCLPASVTVPILEALRGFMSAAPVTINPNPPATQENIDSLPVVLYGKEPDPFHQTDCAICRNNFEVNEELKKLQCGHLFHPACVTNWLLITRICPICRRRMSITNA